MLGFTVLSEGFPRELTARANTALNLSCSAASFLIQWGIGVVVDAAVERSTSTPRAVCDSRSLLVFALDVAAYAWFALGWRRMRALLAASWRRDRR